MERMKSGPEYLHDELVKADRRIGELEDDLAYARASADDWRKKAFAALAALIHAEKLAANGGEPLNVLRAALTATPESEQS